jgi:hypothetical protein
VLPMRRITLLLFLLISMNACVSVDSSIVQTERLVLQGLQAAARNQELIIEAHAADQKSGVIALMESSVIDDVIAERADGEDSLALAEVKALLIEYANDLEDQFATIETQKNQLLAASRNQFETLQSLVQTNIAYLQSLVDLTESRNSLVGDRNRQRLDQAEQELIDLLNPDNGTE